jgi:hypothetical protein
MALALSPGHRACEAEFGTLFRGLLCQVDDAALTPLSESALITIEH